MADFDEMFDFVVVGSGGGSMCAALHMRSRDRSVVILEKTGLIGGTTARSGGVMWIPNNPFLTRDGVDESFEKASTYLESVLGTHDGVPGSSPERRRAYLTEAPRMVEFLRSQGIKLNRISAGPTTTTSAPAAPRKGAPSSPNCSTPTNWERGVTNCVQPSSAHRSRRLLRR